MEIDVQSIDFEILKPEIRGACTSVRCRWKTIADGVDMGMYGKNVFNIRRTSITFSMFLSGSFDFSLQVRQEALKRLERNRDLTT